MPTSSSPASIAASDFPDDIFDTSESSASTGASSKQYSSAPASVLLPSREDTGSADDALGAWARTTRFAVLSHFSQVTNAARSSAHALLSHPIAARLAAEGSAGRGGPRAAGLADAITSFAQHGPVGPLGPSDPEWRHSEAAKAIGGEFDSARVFLARFARQVAEQAERSRIAEQEEARRKAQQQSASASGGDTLHEPSILGAFEILDLQPSVERPTTTRSAKSPITPQEWAALFDEAGAPLIPLSQVRRLIFQRSLGAAPTHEPGADVATLDVGLRGEAWPFLLGAERWRVGESLAQRRADREERARQYWAAKRAWAGPSAAPLQGVAPAPSDAPDPLGAGTSTAELEAKEARCAALREKPWMKEQTHRIKVDCLRTDRKLPLFAKPPTSPTPPPEESSETPALGGEDPAKSKAAAAAAAEEEESAPRPNPHMKALADVLLTYVIWDQQRGGAAPPRPGEADSVTFAPSPAEVGLPLPSGKPVEGAQTALGSYVQGMSDLCAPLYVVCGADEAQTFWCFAGFMDRVRSNFYSDQSGMRGQLSLLQKLIQVMDPAVYAHLERTDSLHLFFCFRWLLVLFKREFDFPAVLKLWEALWASELRHDDDEPSSTQEGEAEGLTDHLHLFVVLAILQQHRVPLLGYLYNFDEILLYFQGLSQTIDVEATLAQAEVLARTLAALIEQRDAADAATSTSGAKKAVVDAPAAAALPVIPDELRKLVRVAPKAPQSSSP